MARSACPSNTCRAFLCSPCASSWSEPTNSDIYDSMLGSGVKPKRKQIACTYCLKENPLGWHPYPPVMSRWQQCKHRCGFRIRQLASGNPSNAECASVRAALREHEGRCLYAPGVRDAVQCALHHAKSIVEENIYKRKRVESVLYDQEETISELREAVKRARGAL